MWLVAPDPYAAGRKGFVASIVLPNGVLAGEGHARGKAEAMRQAAVSAIDAGYKSEAVYHAQRLPIADENEVRAYAAAAPAQENPFRLRLPRVNRNTVEAVALLAVGAGLVWWAYKAGGKPVPTVGTGGIIPAPDATFNTAGFTVFVLKPPAVPGQPVVAPVPAGGLAVVLPQGAVWGSPAPEPTGTPYTMFVPHGLGTQSSQVQWIDAGGSPQTILLTLVDA